MIYKGDKTLVFDKNKLDEYKEKILESGEKIDFYEQRLILGYYGVLGWILSKAGKTNFKVMAQKKDFEEFKKQVENLDI